MSRLDVKQGVGGVDGIDVEPGRGRVMLRIHGWEPTSFTLTPEQARAFGKLLLEAAADSDVAPKDGP